MEVLSKYSKIITSPQTQAISIPDSVLCYQESIPVEYELSTPATESTKILHFSLNPIMESDLILNETCLETHWQLKHVDSSPILSSEQPSILNYIGLCAYSRCELKIAGESFLPTIPHCRYSAIQKLTFGMTPQEKETKCFQFGWVMFTTYLIAKMDLQCSLRLIWYVTLYMLDKNVILLIF